MQCTALLWQLHSSNSNIYLVNKLAYCTKNCYPFKEYIDVKALQLLQKYNIQLLCICNIAFNYNKINTALSYIHLGVWLA